MIFLNKKQNTDDSDESFSTVWFFIESSCEIVIKIFEQTELNTLFELNAMISSTWWDEIPFWNISMDTILSNFALYVEIFILYVAEYIFDWNFCYSTTQLTELVNIYTCNSQSISGLLIFI